MIVVDASLALEVLLNTTTGERAAPRLLDPRESLHAPHLIDLEVAQVLRRYVAAKEIPAKRAGEALSDLAGLPLTRYPHEPFLPRIWQLRANLSAYDAAYVALAETLGASLWTLDAKLAATHGHGAGIELLS